MANKTVIEGSSISASQLKEMFDQIANGTLNGVHMQALIEHRNPFAEGGIESLFKPHAYFKTRQGLWVADSFVERILAKQSVAVPHRGLDGVTSQILQCRMYDKEIISELLGGMEEVCKHSFTLDQVAEMINFQTNGEDGKLMNNGYANIFYVLASGVPFAVHVHWDSDSRRSWSVDAWPLDEDGYWNAGSQIFRNTTL